jgi:hypothetical protein
MEILNASPRTFNEMRQSPRKNYLNKGSGAFFSFAQLPKTTFEGKIKFEKYISKFLFKSKNENLVKKRVYGGGGGGGGRENSSFRSFLSRPKLLCG